MWALLRYVVELLREVEGVRHGQRVFMFPLHPSQAVAVEFVRLRVQEVTVVALFGNFVETLLDGTQLVVERGVLRESLDAADVVAVLELEIRQLGMRSSSTLRTHQGGAADNTSGGGPAGTRR